MTPGDIVLTPSGRLDVKYEAKRLADRINGTNRTQGGRRGIGALRLAMWIDGSVSTYGIDTHTAKYMLSAKPHRVVGVYSAPVTVEQIAEDLAEVMR
jgi:hypothetical protein